MSGIKQSMLWFLLLATILAAAIDAQETSTPSVDNGPYCSLYLGLAIPYPDSLPILTAPKAPDRQIPNGTYPVTLTVDKKGQVKKLLFPQDSAFCYLPLSRISKSIRFRFLEGGPMDFPVTVPALLDYHVGKDIRQEVTLRLPVSAEMITDSSLLTRFFAANEITPPRLIAIPALFYRFYPVSKENICPTITARVSLDAAGQMNDLTLFDGGYSGLQHPVHSSLLYAAFEPARRKGKPFPCEFLLTFRFFDNLRYPFPPLQPPDTAGENPVTTRYFLTWYFNARDITIFPLPREFPKGVLSAGSITKGRYGNISAGVWIDPQGKVSAVNVDNAKGVPADAARKAILLLNWYPALDNHGNPVWFSGRIRLILDGKAQVVYNPEWFAW